MVIQEYDTLSDQWISQRFVADETIAYRNQKGELVDPAIMGDPEPQLPFDMVQPVVVK